MKTPREKAEELANEILSGFSWSARGSGDPLQFVAVTLERALESARREGAEWMRERVAKAIERTERDAMDGKIECVHVAGLAECVRALPLEEKDSAKAE